MDTSFNVMFLPASLIAAFAPSSRGWNIQLPWCGDEADHFAFRHQLNNPLSQPLTGQKQVLTNITESLVAFRVGIV